MEIDNSVSVQPGELLRQFVLLLGKWHGDCHESSPKQGEERSSSVGDDEPRAVLDASHVVGAGLILDPFLYHRLLLPANISNVRRNRNMQWPHIAQSRGAMDLR